jgi:hypothetical protein
LGLHLAHRPPAPAAHQLTHYPPRPKEESGMRATTPLVVFWFLVAFLSLALVDPGPANAQWGAGGCRTVVRPAYTPVVNPGVFQGHAITPSPAPSWEWRTIPSEPTHRYLFVDGRQVGCLEVREGYFRPCTSSPRGECQWGPKQAIDGDLFIQHYNSRLEVIQHEPAP